MDDTGAPKLDPRSHDDVIAQTEALATAYTANVTNGPWLPRADGALDFGGALIRLFGGMVDHLIAQLNKVPDKHRIAFTGLLGARRTPPRPARVPVTFTRTARNDPAAVPAGAQVAATGPDGPIVFETELALALTRAQLAAVYVRDVVGPSGYANQTAIATGKAPGPFDAFAGNQPVMHKLYVAAESMLTLPGAGTLTVTLDGQSAALPANQVVWAAHGAGGWTNVAPVTHTANKWTLSVPAAAFGPVAIDGVTAHWLRATLPAAPPPLVITMAAAFSMANQLPDAAFVNGQPADFTRDVLPFGERPRFNDTFYVASDAAFAVAGTTVQLVFTLTVPPGGVNASTDPVLTLTWESWDGQRATLLGTTTPSAASGITDSTKAFTQSTGTGTVTFTLPGAIPRSTVGAVTSRWVRVRITAGNYGLELSATNDNTTTPPSIKITPASFRPPSIATLQLSWTGSVPAQPPTQLVRQTALTVERLSPSSLPIAAYLPAPEQVTGGAADTRSSLHLGFNRAFERGLTTLYFQVFPPPAPDPAQFGVPPTPRNPPKLVWEYWNGSGWAELAVEDATRNLSRSGLVRFIPPAGARPHTQFGRSLHWLRVRTVDLVFAPMPQLGRVLVNTVWASHAHTSALEVIGASNGARSQSFRLARAPVLDGQRIEVGEPEPPPAGELSALEADEGADVLTPDPDAGLTFVRWHEVPDFWASGPRDRHYTFDAETGAVTFGDGSAGMIPPIGVQNIRAAFYQSGGGTAGNVAAGAVDKLQTTVALVESVTNFEPAAGGAEIEPAVALLERAARTVRHGGRAVTAQDFSDLALESSRAVARAVTITPSFSPIAEAGGPLIDSANLRRDGQVIVVIVPAAVVAGTAPSDDLCAEVEDYLRARCAPDAQVTVTGPSWIATDVTIELAATSLEDSDAVIAAARARAVQLLDPLTGGDGNGWPFGRSPRESDFAASLAGIAALDHISTITVTCTPPFKDTDPSDPHSELSVDELSLYPRLLAYARTITVTEA